MSEEVLLEPTMQQQTQKVGQEEIHGLLFSDKLSWQAIIYDLINTEQLDPWDIDLSVLANKYLERIAKLEEASFFISSKVLAAAALLLRMKAEILLEQDIQSLDDILFGKKPDRVYVQERIILDEEIPELIVRTPLPRFKKVTLEELIRALGNAITTENRRIRKVILTKQQERETALLLPTQKINVQDRIKEVYQQLKEIFAQRTEKLAFSELAGTSVEEKITTFIPLLHLDTQHKIWLEQDSHLAEIWILLKHLYEQQHAPELAAMQAEVEAELEKLKLEGVLQDPSEPEAAPLAEALEEKATEEVADEAT